MKTLTEHADDVAREQGYKSIDKVINEGMTFFVYSIMKEAGERYANQFRQ